MPIDLTRAHLPALLGWARASFPFGLRTETPFAGEACFIAEVLDPRKPDPSVPLDFFEADRRDDGSLFVFLSLDPELADQGGGPDWEGALGFVLTQVGADAFRLHTVEAWGDCETFEVYALDGEGRVGSTMRSCIAPHATNHARFTALKRELARLLADVPPLPDAPLPAPDPSHLTSHMRAQEAPSDAYGRTPEPGMWGIECYGDASPGIGGGQGGFLWFTCWEDMLAFAREHLVHLHWGPAGADVDAVAGRTRAIVDRVADAALSRDAAMAELNATLRSFTQLRWWGPFEDMLRGDGAFPRELRAQYRESIREDEEAEPASDAPIEPFEVASFREHLLHWGI